jgi:hypothetical protein
MACALHGVIATHGSQGVGRWPYHLAMRPAPVRDSQILAGEERAEGMAIAGKVLSQESHF